MKFVFLHVGDDIRPTLLVRSIRRLLPDSEIIQCSNDKGARIEGIDRLHLLDDNITNLMTYRLKSFVDLGLHEPATYLDTDILLTSIFNSEAILGQSDVAVCRRTFGIDLLWDTSYKGMNLSEYRGKTLGEVYPYLACFNITSSSHFWDLCYKELLSLDPKFHYWFGDQEAIRNVLSSGACSFIEIPEFHVSCLPEYFHSSRLPIAVHFKGPERKDFMLAAARQMGLL